MMLTRVFQRNFRFLSMLGFGSALICTWEILLAYDGHLPKTTSAMTDAEAQRHPIHQHGRRHGRLILGLSSGFDRSWVNLC